MSKNIVLDVENVSKQYRLGEVGTGSLQHDLKRWWANVRGQEDPFLKIGETNDRTQKGDSDYVWALKDINFQVEQGQAVGIIGRNGAGKSTLLKLLSRVTKPTTGSIKYKGRIASLLEVGTGFHPEMTGRENIYLNGAILGMTRKEITRKFDEIVDFAGVERYIDTPVKRYSSGMYVRLAFAVAAHLESEILIVDEVLAVGDAEFQKKCLGKMGDVTKGEGRTILFVSHNMDSIQNLCDYGILMGQGTIIETGNIDNVIKKYNNSFYNLKDKISKSEGFIRELSINQVGDQLVIDCSYIIENLSFIPTLGFTVSDLNGNTIFGSNMKIHKPTQILTKKTGTGTISCNISQPKLLNGEYILSVWFGDGIVDYEIIEEAIQFKVYNMVKLDYHSSSKSNGSVIPNIKWGLE
ncbi:ABC transporter ATP-binding protein [Empedobacter falsenii]